jgi:hypothetical protein
MTVSFSLKTLGVLPLRPFDLERFHKRYSKGKCWIWSGTKNSQGYGSISIYDKKIIASRISWFIHTGEDIPEGLIIRHKCDNRMCVRPDHLLLGTQADNMEDMKKRGRSHRWNGRRMGEKNPFAKLSDADAKEIVSASGRHADIAARFGISRAYVSQIKSGRRRHS